VIISMAQDSTIFIIRLIVAALLGALIGFERDIHGRAAGLRTCLLVSMGAAVFMILSEFVAYLGQTGSGSRSSGSDPGRIAAQVVTGIGFLGAGTILKEGLTIRGLTTAASLWVVAGVGMAAGAGWYPIAIGATLIALCGLVGLQYFERFYQKDSYRILTIAMSNDADLSRIIDTVKSKKLKIVLYDIDRDYVTNTTTIRFSIRLFYRGITDKFSHEIIKSLERSTVPLKSIRWDHL
jgi:putative Mg2+ transporter-C (MgtC) family protein